jgi:hypothetical protein
MKLQRNQRRKDHKTLCHEYRAGCYEMRFDITSFAHLRQAGRSLEKNTNANANFDRLLYYPTRENGMRYGMP